MFRAYVCTRISKWWNFILHKLHKIELAISLSQNIGLWKQIALAITFGLATTILKDNSYFSSHKTIATDAYTYAMSYEDFGKIRVS